MDEGRNPRGLRATRFEWPRFESISNYLGRTNSGRREGRKEGRKERECVIGGAGARKGGIWKKETSSRRRLLDLARSPAGKPRCLPLLSFYLLVG